MECVCVFTSMYVHRKKILKDITKIVYNIYLWQALISMIYFLLCVSYFFYKEHTSVIQTSPVTWSRIPIWLWGYIYVIYCPHLQIQQAKDWKYSRGKKFHKVPKSKTWICPLTGNHLHSTYIVFTTIYIAFPLY